MKKVLRIDFVPVINLISLDRIYNANIDKLEEDIITTWSEISGASYEVVGKEVCTDIPPKQDGFQYTPTALYNVLAGTSAPHMPDYADYTWIINKFDLVNRRNAGEFDEVHMFGAPYMGFYESNMVGRTAIWCNSGATFRPCDNFVIMGFNYERGLSEAIHDFGHRSESILAHSYPDFWRAFSKEVGTIHTPFNTSKDYDYINTNQVECYADKYIMNPYEFIPEIKGCECWGCDAVGYYKFWFSHIPKSMWDLLVNVEQIK